VPVARRPRRSFRESATDQHTAIREARIGRRKAGTSALRRPTRASRFLLMRQQKNLSEFSVDGSLHLWLYHCAHHAMLGCRPIASSPAKKIEAVLTLVTKGD
jgi:hypothetical protein